MHTVFALLCFVVVIHWLIFPYPSGFTSLALWQSNDCPCASKATLMNMDKYFMWIHYERLHNHHKAKHNKIQCIFLGIYCINASSSVRISLAYISASPSWKTDLLRQHGVQRNNNNIVIWPQKWFNIHVIVMLSSLRHVRVWSRVPQKIRE